MASILLFREKFPREARKNDVAHPGLARFANFFSLDSHATIEERNFPSRGERAPRKFRQRRALAACTRVNVRMSRLDLLVSLSSAAWFVCSNATLVAFRLTILSTKLRPVRRGNGTKEERRGGGETEMETRRATDCSNRVYEVPVDRKARGHVARLRGREEREEGRRYLAVCDSNNEGSLEVHSADVLSWAKLMRFLFLQFRCFVLNLASLNVESNFFFSLWQI